MTNNSTSFDEQINSAIQSSPYLAGRQLRYEAAEGRIVLKGVVSSFFQKQMAQEALRGIRGLEQIDNQLEVTWA